MQLHAKTSTSRGDRSDRYCRLFPNLEALELPEREITRLAEAMTKEDAQEDNPRIPAGYTYFGQFVAHDLTFDPAPLKAGNAAARNYRTPRFDLDCLYGAGPTVAPHLYDRSDFGRLLLGEGRDSKRLGTGESDLPRNQQGTALVGDPRNDENIMVSQIHVGLIRYHNAWMRRLETSMTREDAFTVAQQQVQWHYQWVVLNDFLPLLVGERMIHDVLPTWRTKARPRTVFRCVPERVKPQISLEFAVAAYRVGHAMVRGEYSLNDWLDKNYGRVPLFDDSARSDLRGGRFLPPHWTIQWSRFLPTSPDATPQASARLSPRISPALASIPGLSPSNLAERSLRRASSLGLPSGQRVARLLGEAPCAPDLQEPLWIYVLREAAEAANGEHLGPVGGRIVAETFISLLTSDADSFVNREADWSPANGTAQFRLANLILAGHETLPDAVKGPAYWDLGPSHRTLLPQGVVEVNGEPVQISWSRFERDSGARAPESRLSSRGSPANRVRR